MNLGRLELNAWETANEIGISNTTWNKFTNKLVLLKNHSPSMYAHSLRVGLYSYGIAKEEQWDDLTLPFLGGCGHDLGKCNVPVSVLDKTGELTEADWAVLHKHPVDGYEMWKDEFPFTAMIAGLHHAFTPKAYGIQLSDAPSWLKAEHTHKIVEATMVVMICDFWDAVTTRQNSSTIIDPNDTIHLAEMLREHFADWPDRCDWLHTNLI